MNHQNGDSKPTRYIELQSLKANTNSKYIRNIITTTHYTRYNFFPKALLNCFCNLPKLWFLFITALELVNLSDTTYKFGTLIPLVLLVLIHLCRECIDDIYRNLQDNVINYKEYYVWDGIRFTAKYCKDILAGDIIVLRDADEIPADIMLLSVGNEEHLCYVDASDIMGEGGLKIKSPARETQAIINTLNFEQVVEMITLIDNDLHVVPPNKAFKGFSGKFRMATAPTSNDVTIKNLILRGMKIVHTPWVLGVVVYTGIETKIWINNLCKTNKTPKLNQIMEKWLLWGFSLIFLCSSINTIIYSVTQSLQYSWYEVFLANLIMFNHIVPISLFLAIELVRVFLNFLIRKQAPNVFLNNPNLCSNLGMIEYIVTDKTGTLTENNLRVAVIIINETLFYEKDDEDSSSDADRFSANRLNESNNTFARYTGPISTFKALGEELVKSEVNDAIHQFFCCLSLCNLAVPENGEFLSISLDDKILAYSASTFGFRVDFRDEAGCEMTIIENDVSYYVLGTQASASEHKRSRIVVKRKGSNEVFMYIKGRKNTIQHIFDDFEENFEIEQSIINYRSLYLGYKKLTKREVEDFMFDYSNAKMSLVNKEGTIESVFEKYEKNASFLGIIGIDDTVTEETKETVRSLQAAGLKFWILSGDSEESTITAALSSGIFPNNQEILKLENFISDIDCLNYLEKYLKKYVFPGYVPEGVEEIPGIRCVASDFDIREAKGENEKFKRNSHRHASYAPANARRSSVHPAISRLSLYKHLTQLQNEYNPTNLKFVLSIDSNGFEMCLETQIHLKYFIFLLFTAKAVCFHSLLPDQKAKVIKLMTTNFRFNPMILAIGDSMSDIGMIQEAHVGIAIAGNSASNSADVVISKFSDLTSLLLIHGHKQYIQISKMALLSFYAMSLLEFLFSFFNMVSGWNGTLPIYKDAILGYKLVASIIPLAVLCLFDKDNSSTRITPQAYKAGFFNSVLTLKNLFWYVLAALIQSIFVFITTLFFFSTILESGFNENFLLIDFSLSFILYNTVVLTVVIETYSLSLQIFGGYLLSMVIGVLIFVPMSYTNEELNGINSMLKEYKLTWCYIFMNLLFNAAVIYLLKASRFLLFPGILEKVRSESPNNSLQDQDRLKMYRKTLNKVFRESAEFNKKKEYEPTKLNTRYLKFTSEFLERQYQDDKIAENLKNFVLSFLLVGLLLAGFCLIEILEDKKNITGIIFLALSSGFFLLSALAPKLSSFQEFSYAYIIIYYALMQVFFLLCQIVFSYHSLPMLTFCPFFVLLNFSNHWFLLTITAFAGTFSAVAVFVLYSLPSHSLNQVIFYSISYAVFYLTLCTLSSNIAYHIDKSKRIEFLLVKKIILDIQKTKGVLNFLLPAFVRKRVKAGVRFISENQGVVSILFCDIENFDILLTNYNSNELTLFLDEVFLQIDQICMLSGCTKIETVGKTYMACAGLKESDQEMDSYYSKIPSSRRCVEMGIAIVRLSETIFLKNHENLKFKIGIHTGEVTAGVVGYHKPQFSLVGDTVNTASRMASLCPEANVIQISEQSYEDIKDFKGFNFSSYKLDVKGKGILVTYLVSLLQQNEPGSSSKLGLINSMSLSELFSFKSASKSRKNERKTTLFKFTNQHADHDQRRSSMIDILNEDITPDDTFIKRETEIIEKVKWFTFSCKETRKEKNFRVEIRETTYPVVFFSALTRIVCNVIILLILVVELGVDRNLQGFYELLRLLIEIVVQGMILLNLRKFFSRLGFVWIVGSAYLIGAISKIGIDWVPVELIYIDFLLHALQAAHCSQLFFKHFIMISICLFVCFIIFTAVTQIEGFAERVYGLIAFLLVLLYSVYLREKTLRFYSNITKAANRELKKINELLTEMMPKHVFEKLREQDTVTENINDVTILYADIVGFTFWASKKSPGETVNMLSDLFTRFDMECKNKQVYKVHTIGDCYVAMGYLESSSRDIYEECKNIVEFALDLVQIIQEVNSEKKSDLNMRIGVHTGNIIGGITGTSIVRYDIYGIDVLIANKMESTGEKGKVQISQATYELLSEKFSEIFVFEPHKKQEFYGKHIESYFVTRK